MIDNIIESMMNPEALSKLDEYEQQVYVQQSLQIVE